MEPEHASDVTDLQRVLHRWFVQYNPLYLISATLCLAGTRILVCALDARANNLGELGVAAVTELYAVALIAGAALLTRIGKRRAGVMLGLLAAVYQGDLALHTEACTCLGAIGIAAAAAWVAIFVAKLYALAWAVKLRPSRAAYGLATYAGVGLAVVPHLVAHLDDAPRAALVALWVFSVAAVGLHAAPRVASAVALDAWGQTVLRRALGAAAALGSLLLALHVVFWSVSLHVGLWPLAPAAALLATRAVRREARAWAVVLAVLVLVALAAPALFATAALMASATLALRAHRTLQPVAPPPTASAAASPFRAADVEPDAPASPFRAADVEPDAPASPVLPAWVFAPPSPAARRRLLTGALFAGYLAVWTLHWSGGPWPAHIAALDLALTAVVLVAAVKLRGRVALAPLAASYAHLLVQVHLVAAPRTTFAWGALCTGTAFALLLASLALDYRLRAREPGGQ